MDKNIFNNLLTKVDSLQTRLKAYNSFKSEHCRKGNCDVTSKIDFNDKDGNMLASFTLDSKTSNDILALLIEGTKTELESTAEVIKTMITEEE